MLIGLEELTGGETRDGLLESPERGRSSLLTQLGNDVKLDIAVDVGYGDESGNQVELGGSQKFGDARLASELRAAEPLLWTCSSRGIWCTLRHLVH